MNFGGAASGGSAQTDTFSDRLFSETRTMAAVYPKPSRGGEFDFGGGVMFNPHVGLGVSFSGTAHQDTAGLGVTLRIRSS